MDANDKRDLDRILNVLYKESPLAWYKIYTDLGLEKHRADHLFKIGFAFNYLQIEDKGMDEYPTDNHSVGLTNEGIQFFALSNFSGTDKTVETRLPVQRFNIYINGSLGGFNLLDIDAEQLQIVIDAYLEEKPDFTIAGQNYCPKKFHALKIFENTAKRNARELKKLGNEQGSKKGFMGKFFSEEDLEELGENLTYSIIGNAQSGSGKSVTEPSVTKNATDFNSAPGDIQLAENTTDKQIFISYSWDSQEYEDHVFSFANELRENGFNVDIDKIISQRKTSTNFNQMMHEAFLQSEHIIVVLSKGYKEKADAFQGGVGVEYRIILGEIDKYPRKYILVSFQGHDDSIIPMGLIGRDVIDISKKGLDPLFRKLTAQPEYVLSPVSKAKPSLPSREVASFANLQAKTNKTGPETTTAELIAKRIEKKKQLRKDFAGWLNYKKEDVKKRFRMIIHTTENDTYPDQPMIPNTQPTWSGAEIHGSSHLGMEFCNENTQIYIDHKGNWSAEPSDNLKAVDVSVIKTIAYDDIVAWDMDGDGIYNCPHFYVNFNDGTPWKDISYVDHKKKYVHFNSSNKIQNA
ncbi:toll/interleukin-1 receptor domain-containing protein [Pedobacter heparinus]|uniref:toll/interleukin-1 receptor domain-containing protein n=1 Tax=Pedobacter heparinus TaxID=984 RepID=UPI00292FFF54|nr:toll/interleukin-1 receptor domain-containing protein [Pedobacter heparinus]